MKMFRKDEGFTLIELMVVVLIIGILVAIAIPVFNAARTTAQAGACKDNLRTIDGAARTYQAENDVLPAQITDLVGPYLKAEPRCPAQPGTAYGWDAVNGSASCTIAGHTYP